MTKEEKRERIRYLWGRVRTHVIMRRFIFKAKKEVSEAHLLAFAQVT